MWYTKQAVRAKALALEDGIELWKKVQKTSLTSSSEFVKINKSSPPGDDNDDLWKLNNELNERQRARFYCIERQTMSNTNQ